ncbi:MAG: GumC family protein, partial [Pseudomonadota bacterium]
MFGADNDSYQAGAQPRAESPRIAPHGQPPQALTIVELVQRGWAARWYAIIGALVMSVLGVVFWMVAEPSYQSSAQVYVDPKDLQLLENDLTPSLMPGDSGTVIIESQARIMQSASVLRAVVIDLELDSDEEFVGKKTGISLAALKAWVKDLFASGDGRPVDKVTLAVDELAKAVNVVRADKTYLISVFAKSRDPEKAARIANGMVAAYLDLRERQRASQADTASRALEGRLEGLFRRLETAEEAVERYKVENGIIGASGSLLVEDRLTQATRDIAAAELSVDRARAQRDQLALMRDNPSLFLSSAEAVGSTDVSRLRADLERVEAEIGTLSATLGARHPRLVEAESRRASVRRSLQAEVGRLYSNAVLAYERAESRLAAATASVGRLTRDVQASDASRVRLRQLERDAQTGRALYEEALLRSRETRERQT